MFYRSLFPATLAEPERFQRGIAAAGRRFAQHGTGRGGYPP